MRLKTAADRAAQRAAMIPQGAQPDPRNNGVAAVWYYNHGEVLYGIGFWGSSGRPSWHYRFRSPEARKFQADELFSSAQAHATRMDERKQQRDAFAHTLKVGDLAHTSWGYDQTNVEFYEVTRIVSPHSVEVRQIAGNLVETGFMCGNTTPQPGQFIGEPRVCRVREGNTIVNPGGSKFAGHYDAWPTPAGKSIGCSWYA